MPLFITKMQVEKKKEIDVNFRSKQEIIYVLFTLTRWLFNGYKWQIETILD